MVVCSPTGSRGAGGELAVSIPAEPLGIRQPHDLAGSRNTAAGDAKIGYAIETAMLRPPGDTERIGAPAWVDSSGPVAPAFAPFIFYSSTPRTWFGRPTLFLYAYTVATSEPTPPILPKYMHQATDTPRLLLQRTAAGDKEAFRLLYLQYGPRVTAMVRRRIAVPELVEDLVQDVFVAAWQTAQGYRSDLGDPELWLLGITRHKLGDHWRRLGRIAEWAGVPWEEPAVEAALPRPEVRLSIAQALGALSIEQRRVIDLIYGYGLTFTEAARVLGVPVGTVKSRANAGLGKMKAFLSK